eukprot:2529723-Pleurochrysis_carterae.AAC.1
MRRDRGGRARSVRRAGSSLGRPRLRLDEFGMARGGARRESSRCQAQRSGRALSRSFPHPTC